MDLGKLKEFLSQQSTIKGIVGLLGVLGFIVSPGNIELIVGGVIGVIALINTFQNEDKAITKRIDKKVGKAVIVALAFSLLLMPVVAQAAGSWTGAVISPKAGGVVVVDTTFTADAADASVPDNTIQVRSGSDLWGTFLYRVVTDPGTPAPTNLYDITIDDADSLDMCAGNCQNRATATTEKVVLTAFEPIVSDITITVSGNIVNSATGRVRLIFVTMVPD